MNMNGKLICKKKYNKSYHNQAFFKYQRRPIQKNQSRHRDTFGFMNNWILYNFNSPKNQSYKGCENNMKLCQKFYRT